MLRVLLVYVCVWCACAEDWCEDTCAAGPWSELLERWALTPAPKSAREGRIMALPPATGYYVSDRVDRPPPPPPPPHRHHNGPPPNHHHTGPAPDRPHRGTPPHHAGPQPYDEWRPADDAADGKIVNRPNADKDKFKPSPQYPLTAQQFASQLYPGPVGAIDRVGEAPPAQHAPPKQVSETDLYLLSAIEKLVWRVDLMEKRLRKLEENMHYLVVGVDKHPEPCLPNFSRVGATCYHFSEKAADWKSASVQCRQLRANLLELDSEQEKRTLVAAMLLDKRIRGMDIWTGGLNPGLLWIWSHSARPVSGNSTGNSTVLGDGRCLALVHDAARNQYVYRGEDCVFQHHFICEKEDDKTTLSNEVYRVSRALSRVAVPYEPRAARTRVDDAHFDTWHIDD